MVTAVTSGVTAVRLRTPEEMGGVPMLTDSGSDQTENLSTANPTASAIWHETISATIATQFVTTHSVPRDSGPIWEMFPGYTLSSLGFSVIISARAYVWHGMEKAI